MMDDLAKARIAAGLRPYADDMPKTVNNTSGVVPMDTKCLVLPDPVETQRGGILLPDAVIEKDAWKRQRCTLIASGAMAFHDWGADKPSPGNRVFVSQYAGSKIEADDGLTYWIINDADIIGGLTT